jgi:hypothetical protein
MGKCILKNTRINPRGLLQPKKTGPLAAPFCIAQSSGLNRKVNDDLIAIKTSAKSRLTVDVNRLSRFEIAEYTFIHHHKTT